MCETYIQTPKSHFYITWKQSYDTLRYSGGHFEFCPLVAKAPDEFRGLLVFCSGRVQDAIPQISSLSDLNPNVTGLFAEIYLERDHDQNFDEITSCVTIF